MPAWTKSCALQRASLDQFMRMIHVSSYMLEVLHWLPICQRTEYRVAALVWRCLQGLTPIYFCELCCLISIAPGRRLLYAPQKKEFFWFRLLVPQLCRIE